jgi:PEP-CTERM motif
MKKLSQRSMFLLLFIVILGGTWGAQRAYADTVTEFTGTWYTRAVAESAYDESYNETIGPILFDQFGNGLEPFFFTAPVTSGTLRTCTSDPCTESYSGTFVGGTISMYLDDPAPPAFIATITGGSYSGLNEIPCVYPDCMAYDAQTINFTGQWANGWTSVGTLSAGIDHADAGPPGLGTLTMTTTTAPAPVPEPGTMTLLGTGMVLLVASLRLRLRNSSPVP